ncbi:hypothetical protein L1887_22381 [Cichorium endivia]|nr:hypothetical protein L1887_22381 [Cichorium endivia]
MERFTLLGDGSSFNHRTIKSVYTTQAKNGGKQMGSEEKKAAVHEEIKKVNQLPAHSTYATHRIRVLNKILQPLSVQRTTSQDEEPMLLFAGFQSELFWSVHSYNTNGLCVVGFIDDHYPVRSAFSILNKVMDEYQKCFGDSWKTIQPDGTQPWPYLNEAVTKFQCSPTFTLKHHDICSEPSRVSIHTIHSDDPVKQGHDMNSGKQSCGAVVVQWSNSVLLCIGGDREGWW